MRRPCTNERDAFPKSVEAYTSEIEPALRHRRAELDEEWAKLEEGWKQIEERRVAIGVRPRTDEEGMMKVNFGGSVTSLSVSLLAEVGLFDDGNALGGLLEGIWESKDVPRDHAGRIIVDESSECLKHIIQTMLDKGPNSHRECSSALSANHLRYTSCVLGTRQAIPTDTKHATLKGGSTVLRPLELLPMSAVIRGWCPDKPGELNLIYRASRDGFDTKSFRARCTKETCDFTITLIRVACDGAVGDSVVGGYSTVPWANIPESTRVDSPRAFIFMLRDGTCAHPDAFTPVKWTISSSARACAVRAAPDSGPCFGGIDLRANFKEEGACTIQTGRNVYKADSAAFLGLDGNEILDIEVYGVCSEERLASGALKASKTTGGAEICRATANDNGLFGKAIANSLTEEQVALQHAFKVMNGAEARVAAASQALQTVYGPDLEANNEGLVVELNVHGTTMTTLRSTLQACPESALAARFDEEKWPVAKTDCDERGRRLIDCRPAVFSKVLDALRIRKRESWSLSKAEIEARGAARGAAQVIVVEEDDRPCLEEFVDMYFPGCQSFITDLVVCDDATQAQDAPARPPSAIRVDFDEGNRNWGARHRGDYW